MERGYFGPSAMSAIFHNEVRNALRGLPGVLSIHDNIAVYGKDVTEHYQNLRKCFERLKEKGIVIKQRKSNFCMYRIK